MGGENPNTPLSTLGLDFSVFVYLPWKRPHGPGRKWANSRRLGRPGWGTRSRIVFHAGPLPALGLLQEP